MQVYQITSITVDRLSRVERMVNQVQHIKMKQGTGARLASIGKTDARARLGPCSHAVRRSIAIRDGAPVLCMLRELVPRASKDASRTRSRVTSSNTMMSVTVIVIVRWVVVRVTVFIGVARAGSLDVFKERFEAELDGVDVPDWRRKLSISTEQTEACANTHQKKSQCSPASIFLTRITLTSVSCFSRRSRSGSVNTR